MKDIVLASGNRKKILELEQLLAPLDMRIVPQRQLDIEDAIEDGLSFVENALIKARHASKQSGLPAIADDSGIEVDALQGRPGIYSARFSGEQANDESNNALLLKQLDGIATQQRSARYQCVLVYMRHSEDPTPIICQGSWEGTILTEPTGNGGFGYDPLFYVASEQCSAAELDPERKAQLSHRGKAMQLLLAQLQNL